MSKRPPAARTAFGPMVITAVERYQPAARRIVDDELAVRFLPRGLRPIVRACRWRLPRGLLLDATAKRAPGIWGGMLCRKRYADDKVTEAIEAGIEQIVILGAGLDTRAYRLAVPAGVPAFEVDLPANIAYKQDRLREIYGRIPENVHLVPNDFGTDDLAQSLAATGFRLERPTVFVWEAVTQYLTEDGIRATFAFLAKAAAGSRLLFTFVRKDFLDGTNLYDSPTLHQDFVSGRQRIWHFGINPDDAGPLLKEYGWTETEQVGDREYRTRYVEPTGRQVPVSPIERFVHAVKQNA